MPLRAPYKRVSQRCHPGPRSETQPLADPAMQIVPLYSQPTRTQEATEETPEDESEAPLRIAVSRAPADFPAYDAADSTIIERLSSTNGKFSWAVSFRHRLERQVRAPTRPLTSIWLIWLRCCVERRLRQIAIGVRVLALFRRITPPPPQSIHPLRPTTNTAGTWSSSQPSSRSDLEGFPKSVRIQTHAS
jgi:hypothetical protein